MKLKFTQYKNRPGDTDLAAAPDGSPLYRLEIDGRTVRSGLTIDEVIEAINRRDEEKLGEQHTPARR